MIAKAGLRVFIWSQTGYHPIDKALSSKVTELEQKLAVAVDAIATLQTQVQPLHQSSNTPAPGWTQENWDQLSHQDKRHFRYLAKKRRFRPSDQGEELRVLPSVEIQEYKRKQRSEVEAVMGSISESEKARLCAAKRELLAKFWSQEGEQP